MAVMRSLPMIQKEDVEIADWSMVVFRFVAGRWFCVFLSYLNRFVYGFCLDWNLSPSRV